MSASNDYMQQLLGGLLNSPQPNSVDGLLGQYGGATNLGLSILAANKPSPVRMGFGNVLAQGALDSQQLAMQQAQQRLALAQGAMSLGMSAQKMNALAPFFGGGVTPQGQGAQQIPQQAAAAVPATQPQPSMPQGTVQTASQPQAVAGYSANAPQSGIDQMPINGMPPDLYRRLAIVNGKDPLETEKEIHAKQLQMIQESVKPQLDALDNVIKSDKPTQYVAANPQLMQAWQQGAPKLGIDPRAGFTDQNVRTVLNFARNGIASQAQMGQEAPTVPEVTQNGPLGSIYQRNPITGKTTQVRGEEDLKQVVDSKTGLPTWVPASQAAGKQPFNASIYGAQNVSDQALQFAADTYRTTGKFPAAFGRNPAMQAKVLEKVASDAAASGDTAGSIAARQGALKANGQALDMNTKKLAVIEPATKKLDLDVANLLAAADKAGGVQSPLVNRAIRAWQQGIAGNGDVAQLVIHLNAVEGEYAKLNSGGTGAAAPSVTVRKEAHDAINKYMSKGTLADVAQAIRMDGQNALKVLQDEKDSLTSAIGVNAPGKPLTHPGQSATIDGFTVTRVK